MSTVIQREGRSSDVPKDRMQPVVDAARAAITQEFQIAERLDAKSRNQVVVGGAWYAGVQAIASIAIRDHIDAGGHPLLFAIVIAVAIVSGVLFGVSIIYAYGVWKLRDEHEITEKSLGEMAAAARDQNVDLLDQLVKHYGFILWTRRENNKKRAESFHRSIPFWIAGIFFGLVELVVALAALAQS